MFFSFFSFLLGLAVGSFLNMLIYRLAQKKSILGRSFCPACQHQLSFFDLIPLFSFFFLRGRCRYCQQKISFQYPLVELATGLLFLFSFLNLHSKFYFLDSKFYFLLLRDWFFIATMVFVFIYDLKFMLIEDVVVIPAIIVIFLINLLLINSITHNLTTLLLGGLFGLGFFLLQYLVTAKKGIGEGDLRLGLLLGLTFAWPKVLVAITSTYLLGGFVALILLLSGKKKLKAKIPLGPFLAIGGLITLFFAEEIMIFWLRF